MTFILGKVKFLINLVLGLLLFILSPSFRATVRAKLRGADDPVHAGEEVIAVLRNDEDVKFIGGKS